MHASASERQAVVRGAASITEAEAAVAVFDFVLGFSGGWQMNRERLLQNYRAAPELLSIAVDDGRIVGSAGCDGVGVVEAVAVLDGWQGRGLGRRLLEHAEGILRERGATVAGLGSLDGAVDFYLSCGYQAQLLVQFAPTADQPDMIIAELLVGPLANQQVVGRDWHGHPQLWLQGVAVDWELKQRVEEVATGVIAQYIMNKRL